MTTAIDIAGLVVAAVGVAEIIWAVWIVTTTIMEDRRR